MAFTMGQVTDILRQKNVVSTTVVRKINTTLGAYNVVILITILSLCMFVYRFVLASHIFAVVWILWK